MNEFEIKILEELKEIKINFVKDIETVIEKYMSLYGDQAVDELNRLGKIDVLGILDIVKFRYLEKANSEVKEKTRICFGLR